MAFTKITNADFNNKGALSMPTRPSETKSAQEIQRLFDAPAREVVAPAYNRLIDELEAETGAASLGAVAPTGASGNTVQEILNGVYGAISTAVVDVREIKSEISAVMVRVDVLEDEAHTHSNKELLDTYEQTESDLADAVSKKHAHSNKALLDAYVVPNATIEDTVYKTHTHSNKSVIDLLDEDFSSSYIGLTYDGNPVSDIVSVNGKHGNVALTASDVGALSSSTTLADLSDDSTHRLVTDTEKTTWNGKSVVSVTQVQTTGDKIATITVDGTGTDIYAPEGGAGSGDMKKSDYDSDTTVKDAGGIKAYVTSQIAGLMVKNTYDSDSAVANAGGIARYVSSQISAQITSALTASY